MMPFMRKSMALNLKKTVAAGVVDFLLSFVGSSVSSFLLA